MTHRSSSYTTHKHAQHEIPGDTNKTPSDCVSVSSSSRTVHTNCKSLLNALYFAFPQGVVSHAWTLPEFEAVPSGSRQVGGEVMGGGARVGDTDSYESLAQFTGVLCALTDSHELLLQKIQRV